MNISQTPDQILISGKSHKLLKILLSENPDLDQIINNSETVEDVIEGVRKIADDYLKEQPDAHAYYTGEKQGRKAFEKLSWKDVAAIRILDYVDNSGEKFKDLNLRGDMSETNPFKMIWLAHKYGRGGSKSAFFEDMINLFRQFTGKLEREIPAKEELKKWMTKYPSGLHPDIIKIREENKDRIIKIFIKKIDSGEIKHRKYTFSHNISYDQKYQKLTEWWEEYKFHLAFAIRTPELLNEMLDFSIDSDTMNVMYEAEEEGIPFFVNPYYLSLLNVKATDFSMGADLAIRNYVFYSKQLVEEYGHIVAWEKEDKVKAGKPNAAGWIMPTKHNVHRRYPEVAILIPSTVGRACGGLCASCQRMYDFQRGNLNFDLEKLKPAFNWPTELKKMMKYWEEDSQLRDILITGGDALMSSNKTLKEILESVLEMTIRKKEKNKTLPEGEKIAEMLRIRLGTRLLAYIPQRINDELIEILRDFREKAQNAGMQQFVIQTHFQAPMEITPDAKNAVSKLIEAGWIVTNQHVFTAGASRRGHAAKLRKVLNEIGVLPYYTFTVKGYMENNHNFATNARAVQEQLEEKVHGNPDENTRKKISKLLREPEKIQENLEKILEEYSLSFFASDRNLLNLPGVGKSLTFRTIGITRYGRRILEFDHDHTRSHSPIIDKIGKVIIIESKPIRDYIDQLREMGEDPAEYESIWGYSLGETEPLFDIYEYPEYDYELTDKLTNLDIKNAV